MAIAIAIYDTIPCSGINYVHDSPTTLIARFSPSILCPETLGISYNFGDRDWPIDSFLIYDPYRRKEAWRFVTYMFLHGNHEHIAFNCLMQLMVGEYEQ